MFAGIGALVQVSVAVIVGAIAVGMLPLSGESAAGRIAFVYDRDNDVDIYDIYVMYADGSGVERLADGYGPAWSPVLD